ncbi:MAG TPA: 50S ribosomal protein L25 [Gaiellaceae bacterium]
MPSERHQLPVSHRDVLGSAESRRLRRQGLVPGILYGRERPVAITVPERDLRAALTTDGGLNAVLDVVVDDAGKAHPSVLKEFQRDAVRGVITHVDLQEVRLDQPIHATVPVALVGEAVGVKEGGVLSQVTIEVNVEALPMEVPQHLDLDVSTLGIGDTARLDALDVPEGVRLLDDPDTVLASVTHATRVEEPEEEAPAEGEAAEPGAEPEAEAEAAAESDGDAES